MSSENESLPGFDRVEHDGRVALVRHEYADTMVGLFFGPGIAHEVAKQSGRGAVYTFDLPDGKGILRPYRRGGLLAKFREDRYWRSNRPLKELVILEHAYRHELPVPQPLGVLWEQHGQSFTGAIATRFLSGATLQDWAENHTAEEELPVLHQCGEAIRDMHHAGIYHADLQIRNIIVGNGGVYLIDFDKAGRIDASADVPRARNLLRLRRSIEKNGLPSRYFEAIVEGYGGFELPVVLRAGYRTKGLLSDLARFSRRR
jgi:3-deoxy-D-manno-octulosonic acid kinase